MFTSNTCSSNCVYAIVAVGVTNSPIVIVRELLETIGFDQLI